MRPHVICFGRQVPSVRKDRTSLPPNAQLASVGAERFSLVAPRGLPCALENVGVDPEAGWDRVGRIKVVRWVRNGYRDRRSGTLGGGVEWPSQM